MSQDELKPLKLENEHLREELHKLTLKNDSLRKSYATELDFIREEHEIEKKGLKHDLTKLQEEYKSRELLKTEKNAALTEEINSLREEHEQVLEQVEKYRTQVEILKNAKSAGAASSYSDYEGLKESNKTLRGQLAEKVELLTVQTETISRLNREAMALRGMVAELNEIGEGKDSMIKELRGRVKESEREKDEETGALQNEVLMLKDEIKRLTPGGGEEIRGGGGGASRGNSLFSEVEERRLKVEGELKRLRDLVKKLTTENRSLQLELERGDSHSASITTQFEVISKSELELAMDIKKDKSETLLLFDSYRDRLDSLRTQYTQKLQQYKDLCPTSGIPPASATELETLRQDRDALQLIKISLERDTNELRRELKYNKHLRTHADANVKILKAKLDFLNKPQQPKLDNGGVEPEINDNVSSPVNMNMSVLENTGTPNRRQRMNEKPERCNQQ